MHGPGNAEIEDDTALQTDEGSCEIIYVESGGILRGIKFGIGAQIVGTVAGYGQGLGIAYGVQNHVQGVAADITQRADACCFFFNEGASGNAVSAAAAGLYVVDASEFTGIHDFFNHLHILVHTGLEAEREDFSALFFCTDDIQGFLGGDAHGLFQKDMKALVQSIDGTFCVCFVIGADTYRIQIGFSLQHFFVGRIETYIFHAIAFKEGFCLSGN